MKQKNLLNRIKQKINDWQPSLEADGGSIKLLSYDEKSGTLSVSLNGACRHCSMADYTLSILENDLKKSIPEIKKVINK